MPRKLPALAVAVLSLLITATAANASGGGAAASGGGAVWQPPPEQAYVNSDGLAVAPASAPEEVQAIIAAGNRIAKKPYKYGGGHGSWRDMGYDCSGSVSYVLHAAGLLDTALDSTSFMGWGERGRGTWITIRTNPSHAYMIVAGLRFDTSARSRTGSRWSEQMRSASGFRGRHPEGF